jgi:hypothetical protein
VIGKQGVCSECNEERWLTKPSLGLCAICNKKRLNKSKEKKKPTGEKIVFEQIWEEREHKSYLTGDSLDKYVQSDLWYNLFAHVLAKGKYPKYRLFKKNIVLLTPTEHRLLDQGTSDQRKKYADETGCNWNKIFELKDELYEEYKTTWG